MTVVETALGPLLPSTGTSLADLETSTRHERGETGPRGAIETIGAASTLHRPTLIVMFRDNKKPRPRNL